MSASTRMHQEIAEIPEAVARLLERGAPDVRAAAEALRARDPVLFVTVARGSSDHVATLFKYACELTAGVPVASVGPSVASVYGAPLRLGRAACLAVSQSGASPDIVALAAGAREGGALSFAATNDPASPLARAVAHPLALHAGPETSVAATKTFVASAALALWLLAEWRGDAGLGAAVRALPESLGHAVRADWSPLTEAAPDFASMYCLGRGPSVAVAHEAALKFKETCRLHAEGYSSAEVLHGPVSIVGAGFPVLALAARDAAEAGIAEVADAIAAKGGTVFATTDAARAARRLPAVRTGHPLTDPLALIASFYAAVERIARARGIDPDAPRHLRKVTETT